MARAYGVLSALRPDGAAVRIRRLGHPPLAEPARADMPAPDALVVEALHGAVLLPLAGVRVATLEDHEDVHDHQYSPRTGPNLRVRSGVARGRRTGDPG